MSSKEFSIQNILIGSHLWLGFSATVFTWGTFFVLGQPVSLRYLGFVLSGTMTIYSFHSYFNRLKENKKNEQKFLNPHYLKSILTAGSIITLIAFLLLERSTQMLLLLPIVLAMLYVFPVYHSKRLKDFPYIKIIAIIISWSTVTYWVPVHFIPHWWKDSGYVLLFSDRLLFFFVLAIPFDVRDMQYDTDHSVKTIPNTIGLNNSQYLALFLLIIAGLCITAGLQRLDSKTGSNAGVLMVYLLLGYLIIRLKKNPKPEFYSWIMDGILFLYGITMLLLWG